MYIALLNKIETYPFTSVLGNSNSKSQDKQLKVDEERGKARWKESEEKEEWTGQGELKPEIKRGLLFARSLDFK